MVRFLLTINVLLFFSPLSSQNLIYEFEVGFRKVKELEGSKIGEYYFLKGDAESVSFFYMINPAEGTFDSVRTTEGSVILGSVDRDGLINNYIALGGTQFYCLVFSKEQRKFSAMKKIEMPEMVNLGVVSNEKNFTVLCFDKKNRKLVINRLDSEKVAESLEFTIDDDVMLKYLQKSKFTFIRSDIEASFELAKNQNKIYYENEMIRMVIDARISSSMAETMVISVDVKQKTMNTKRIALSFDPKTDHNSFLHQQTLYVIGINKAMMDLSAYSISDFTRQGQLRYMKGEPLKFKISDLIDNDVNMDKEWGEKWSDEMRAKYTLQKMNGGVPVISVSTVDDENNRILIGKYEIEKTTSAGALRPIGAGGSVSTPGGTLSLPSSYAWVYTNPWGKPSETKTYFFAYLNKEKFAPVTEKKISDHGNFNRARRRINTLSDGIKIDGKGVINSSQASYLIYLNRDNKKMIIETL